MVYTLTQDQHDAFNEQFGGAYEQSGVYYVSLTEVIGVDRDELEEFTQNNMGQDASDVFPEVYSTDDSAERKMRVRKAHLSTLFSAMEANPNIDDTVGRALLRRETPYVESYKYSDAGYSDLMNRLTQVMMDQSDEYSSFLSSDTQSQPSGITVLMAIGGILQVV